MVGRVMSDNTRWVTLQIHRDKEEFLPLETNMFKPLIKKPIYVVTYVVILM